MTEQLTKKSLVFALPTSDHTHYLVLQRLADQARIDGANVVIAQDESEILEACINADGLIADVDAMPELLKRMKYAQPHLALIGLHSCAVGNPISQALDESYAALLKNRCTMMLGLLSEPGQPAARAMIITGERGIQPIKGLDATVRKFIDILESRLSNHHYRTELEISNFPEKLDDDISAISLWIKEWAKWSLFPKYESGDERYPGAEFGFVAKRTAAGTLITARASNKENPTIIDLALIREIDDAGILHVTSAKRKASLNAPLAHLIMRERPEINYIVHSHIFLPEGVNAARISTPGTIEDWQAIKEAVQSGARVVNQPLHGTLILLQKPQELLPLLKANALYQHDSNFYDLAYARFQSIPDKLTSLERAVNDIKLPADPKILDLCCGTGASTLALQELGLENVEFADGSSSMLAVAEQRLARKGRLVRLEDLSGIPDNYYDLITVRQAFAYVKPDDLKQIAQNIARILKQNGRFVFNSFAKIVPGTAKPRQIEHEQSNLLVRTREDNQITDSEVLHTQRTEIIDFNNQQWHAILDVNQFYQHEPQLLSEAFEGAGLIFSMQQQGNSICYIAANRNISQMRVIPSRTNKEFSLQSNAVLLPDETLNELDVALKSIDVHRPACYGDTWGNADLREDTKRITPNWTGESLITGSATQALMLALQHVGRGKTLAINVPCYFGVLRQAKELEIQIKPWQMVNELEALGPIDGILLTSNLTPPAGISYSNSDKIRIANFAKRYDSWIIEDNAYEPLWFDSPPTPIPVDPKRSIRIGSLSKIVSPDFRVGFIRGENEILEAIRSRKITMELSTPRLIQEVARTGVTEQALDRWRNTLKSRIEVMQKSLVRAFSANITMPEGGPYLVLVLPGKINIPALVSKCKTNGLLIDDNSHQYPDHQSRPYLRLHCGGIKVGDIPEAVEVLRLSFKEIQKPLRSFEGSNQIAM